MTTLMTPLAASCGRTVMGVGWNQPIPSEMLAGIVPHVRLQLVDEHGFVVAALGFGIERRDVAVQSDRLPAELLRRQRGHLVDIELSQYPPADASKTSD
jgi:hypothetical protein